MWLKWTWWPQWIVTVAIATILDLHSRFPFSALLNICWSTSGFLFHCCSVQFVIRATLNCLRYIHEHHYCLMKIIYNLSTLLLRQRNLVVSSENELHCFNSITESSSETWHYSQLVSDYKLQSWTTSLGQGKNNDQKVN